jgi:hypothetical protein
MSKANKAQKAKEAYEKDASCPIHALDDLRSNNPATFVFQPQIRPRLL